MSVRKGGLGKGLEALFVDNDTGNINSQTLRISEIEPNKAQPRKDFDDAALADLADSIREHGVLQPLLVRPLPSGAYQLIAGERRWRASRMAGLVEVPVVVREMDDREAAELALIENLQRQDLNPVEESLGYHNLIEKFGMTQEQIAKSVGKSRPVIANALRLLKLPEPVLDMVRKNELSTGHARTLLALENAETIEALAKQVKKNALSVREAEKLVADMQVNRPQKTQREARQKKERFLEELELAASEELGRQVQLQEAGRAEGGTITIEYFGRDDLVGLIEKLTGEKFDITALERWEK